MAVSARTGRRILLLVLAFLGLLVVILLSVVRSNAFRDWLQAEISARSGYTVRAAALSYRLPFGIVAAAVQLSKAPQFELTTERLSVSFNPFDLGSSTLGRLEFEKPELQLDIDEMMKAPRSDPAQIGLRHLSIKDGTIVVRKGGKTLFELPNITLNAENLNLGGQSGVNLRADVPQFHGEAELAIKGQLRDLDSQLIVRPKQSKGIFSRPTTEPSGIVKSTAQAARAGGPAGRGDDREQVRQSRRRRLQTHGYTQHAGRYRCQCYRGKHFGRNDHRRFSP